VVLNIQIIYKMVVFLEKKTRNLSNFLSFLTNLPLFFLNIQSIVTISLIVFQFLFSPSVRLNTQIFGKYPNHKTLQNTKCKNRHILNIFTY